MALNIVITIVYFICIPIVYGAADFKVDTTGSILFGVGYFLSLLAVIFNFVISQYALLNQDWVHQFIMLLFWAAANMIIGGKGIFAKDLVNQDLIIQVFLFAYFITTYCCFYYILCVSSQAIKGILIKREK